MDKNIERSRVIVVSAINFTEGGPLEVLIKFLDSITEKLPFGWRIIALVHDKNLIQNNNVEVVEVRKAKKSWVNRLYIEWFAYDALLSGIKVDAWISLHDITPRVPATVQFVYCHNPAAFYSPSWLEIFLEPKLFVFSRLYKFVYRLRIQKNTAVIVQQEWLRKQFQQRFNYNNVWVARPFQAEQGQRRGKLEQRTARAAPSLRKTFFFPALGRVFKNHILLVEACKILCARGMDNFDILFTLSGDENRYTKWLYKQCRSIKNIRWLGYQFREQMDHHYKQCDALVFPSKLETWGLPISEATAYGVPILLADLPYAHEALGSYDKACFFSPESPEILAGLMQNVIEDKMSFNPVFYEEPCAPYASDWSGLSKMLIAEIDRTVG